MDRFNFRQGLVGLILRGFVFIGLLGGLLGCQKNLTAGPPTELAQGALPPDQELPGTGTGSGSGTGTGTDGSSGLSAISDGLYWGPCRPLTGTTPGSLQYGYYFQGHLVTVASRFARNTLSCGADGSPALITQSAGTFKLAPISGSSDLAIDLEVPMYLDPSDPSKPGILYDRIRVSATTLQFGLKTTALTGSTADKRPTEIDTTITYTLQTP